MGEDHKLSCRSSIDPDAETIWFKGTQRIYFDGNDHLKTNSQHDLIFINPQVGENDPTGKYTCHVKNQFGTTELGYFLTVSLACESIFLILLLVLFFNF